VRGVGMRLWMFVGVARFSPCRVYTAHQGKQGSNSNTEYSCWFLQLCHCCRRISAPQYWNFIAGWFFETV